MTPEAETILVLVVLSALMSVMAGYWCQRASYWKTRYQQQHRTCCGNHQEEE